MRKKSLPYILVACFVVFGVILFLLFNSESVVLWKNGYTSRNVEEKLMFADNEEQICLAAKGNRFSLVGMHKGRFGLWYSESSGSHTSKIAFATTSRADRIIDGKFYIIYDELIAGFVTEAEAKQIYSIPQQTGCYFSTDVYYVSENHYLVLFHLTSLGSNMDALNQVSGELSQNLQTIWAPK